MRASRDWFTGITNRVVIVLLRSPQLFQKEIASDASRGISRDSFRALDSYSEIVYAIYMGHVKLCLFCDHCQVEEKTDGWAYSSQTFEDARAFAISCNLGKFERFTGEGDIRKILLKAESCPDYNEGSMARIYLKPERSA